MLRNDESEGGVLLHIAKASTGGALRSRVKRHQAKEKIRRVMVEQGWSKVAYSLAPQKGE